MAHNFYCGNCGRWVANCGMPDDHSQTFSFSTTCACGNSASGSCGGSKVKMRGGETAVFGVTCEKCGAVTGMVIGKSKQSIKVKTLCPKCDSRRTVMKKMG